MSFSGFSVETCYNLVNFDKDQYLNLSVRGLRLRKKFKIEKNNAGDCKLQGLSGSLACLGTQLNNRHDTMNNSSGLLNTWLGRNRTAH